MLFKGLLRYAFAMLIWHLGFLSYTCVYTYIPAHIEKNGVVLTITVYHRINIYIQVYRSLPSQRNTANR